MWVVLAWREVTREPVEGTGRPDLGLHPEWEDVVTAKAVVWTATGDVEAVEKAKAFGASQVPPAEVFTYPSTEGAPLARARRDVMEVRR